MAERTIGGDRSLPKQVADALRERIRAHEWSPGDQLPSENELVTTYGVSRATVRQSIKDLEAQGLVTVRRGRGTFLTNDHGIHAGMQELASISDTIAQMGFEPGMAYRRRLVRAATPEELEEFGLDADGQVLDIQRKILADRQVVAFSYDILPRWAFPESFEVDELTGSVFGFLRDHAGPRPRRAVASVHAVRDNSIGWDEETTEEDLYVLLDQLQYDDRDRPFMHSRSFFLEGRFNFTVIRTH